MPRYPAFALRLTPEARDAYDRLCRDNNCTLTAVLEAIGLILAEGKTLTTARIVKLARQIDIDRKSRRP